MAIPKAHLVTFRICAQACPQRCARLWGKSEEMPLSLQLCMGQAQGPSRYLLTPELLVLYQQEGSRSPIGFVNSHWFH